MPNPLIYPMVNIIIHNMYAWKWQMQTMLSIQYDYNDSAQTENPRANINLPKWNKMLVFGVDYGWIP